MTEKSTLQRLAGWAAGVASDIADLFVHQDVREAVLADLGGKPGSAGSLELGRFHESTPRPPVARLPAPAAPS